MGNRVCPNQQVQDLPNDQVGNPRYKHAVEQPTNVEPTVKRDTTQWILQGINANAQKKKNQENNVINIKNQQNKSDDERTNYFGEITFGNNKTAKYIRVHSNTKPKTVWKLMKEKWKLENPALVIYVHGSMKCFENSRLATCKTSLKKAVQGTGSWIITDGKQEYVNTDETDDEQPIIIGISQWGAINNKDQTDNQKGTGPAESSNENNSLDPHHSHFILIDDDGSGDTSSTTRKFWKELEREIIKSTSDNGVPLVLLVFQGDDGSKKTVYDAPEKNIPVVIVKESDKKASGNEATPKDNPNSNFTHICEWKVDSCESDLGLAIVKALSKAAKEKMTDHMYLLKLAVAWNMFGIAKNISIDTRKQEDIIESCMMAAILLDKVEYVKLILDNDFDLKTFLTYEKLKELYNAQFEGSLFNEVLPNMIKPIDKDKKQFEGPLFNEVLPNMIQPIDKDKKMNVWKHVERLIDHVRESKPQLRYLDDIVVEVKNNSEKTCSCKQGCFCLRIPCCTCTKDTKPPEDSNEKGCFCRLCIACCTCTKDTKPSEDSNEKGCFRRLRIGRCTCTKDTKPPGQQDEKKQSIDEHPWLDLFVWSVLNNRTDMAKLFLLRGKPDYIKASTPGDRQTSEQPANGAGSEANQSIDFMMPDYIKASTPGDTQTSEQPANGAGSEANQSIDFMMDAMAAALFAHALLSKMSHEIEDKVFKEKCVKDSGDFTNLASGILKEGYNKGGVNLAKKLLIQQQKRWGDTSCVLMAVNANNKQFISEHACQRVFHDIWMGNKGQETGILPNTFKLLLCIFFPLLILFWVTLKKEDKKSSDGEKTDPDSTQTHQDNTRCCSEQGTLYRVFRQEPIWEKLKYFYQAPVVIFFHNVISYILFLGLYSYSLMSKVNRYLSWQEILLCGWAFTIFIHEFIQVFSTPSKDLKSKLHNYIKDGWNILDIVTLVLFLLGMILRIFDNPQVAESALVVHGVNLITFYLRLLHIFSVHRELGPKLVMILKMVYNIAYFLIILAVFIVAYGIASHSILYPHTEPSLETFTEIFRRPYWNIYGELMLDTIEGSADCTNDPELYNSGSYSRCPTVSGKYFVPLLMGVYMLMCNILLLNLLIAMFSSTFQNVQEKSNLYWSFQQYSLINEYANRLFLVPPVIIFEDLCRIIQWIRSCCNKTCCKCNDDIDDIQTVFCRPNVVISYKDQKMVETFYKNGLEHISSNVSEADPANLEKRMEQMEKQLNWIVTTMKESKRIDVEPVYHVPDM